MEQENREQEHKRFIELSFKAHSPVWIITKDDDWVGGYINEAPKELYCVILDRKQNKPIRLFYAKIHSAKEFQGNEGELPRPSYIEKAQTSAKDAARIVPSDDSYNTEAKEP